MATIEKRCAACSLPTAAMKAFSTYPPTGMPRVWRSTSLCGPDSCSANASAPGPGVVIGQPAAAIPAYATASNASFDPSSVTGGGGGQPHENRQPFLATNFIISLFGIFPSQS